MKKIRAITALSLCMIILAGIFSGCDRDNMVSPGPTQSGEGEAGTRAEAEFTIAASYEEVYNAIINQSNVAFGLSRAEMAVEDSMDMAVAAAEGAEAPVAHGAESYNAAGYEDYSKTNVQVEGIDEGDIVKTDGSYIYILKNSGELVIAKADGADTAILSTLRLYEQDEAAGYQHASELYVSGDYVVAIVDSYSNESGKELTKLVAIEVSDRESPKHSYEVGQDGYKMSSRMIGSTIYLMSTYGVYSPVEGDIETFVPGFMAADGSRSYIDADCIAIMPQIDSTQYTLVSAYDLSTGARLGSSTVLGGYGTVYMNSENLYIAIQRYREVAGESYADGVYTVTEYTSGEVTELVRLDITSGVPVIAATATVEGYLNNQFSMDEYSGHLRMVVTVNMNRWKLYYDPQHDFTNYEWEDEGMVASNSLFVLDGGLNIVGKIEELAENETIQSARFQGEIGYFVTFRRTDPLFAVDLSDPANPTILSALKIPGFSEYLHIFGEGRLLGIGMSADEDTGMTSGMKLSMFNTENPKDVTEKHVLPLDVGYSTALDNHKAILISAEKDVIAFPTGMGYQVYGYSDESGFYLRAEIGTGDMGYDARGLYIGDTAYIVGSSAIYVLDLAGFSLAATVTF